ncbi:MAG: hypothetical protein FWE31_02260 [Firmicutes bacterium]|nr:hypothetical protein [Bacillota bacterium]
MDKLNYDVIATVSNQRNSRNPFYTGYRPAFAIHNNYITSGEIRLLGTNQVKYREEIEAQIRFLTPEVYPKCLWVGKKIAFQEGAEIHGFAIITEILNKSLESDEVGIEGDLRLD